MRSKKKSWRKTQDRGIPPQAGSPTSHSAERIVGILLGGKSTYPFMMVIEDIKALGMVI